MPTDRLLLTAGILAIFTALVHVGLGTPSVQPLLLGPALPLPVGLLLLVCWYMAGVALAVSGIAILWSARQAERARTRPLLTVVASMWLLFGLVFVVVGLSFQGVRGLLLLPQWVLLVPVGMMTARGARRAGRAAKTGAVAAPARPA